MKTRGCLFALKSTMVISKLHYYSGEKLRHKVLDGQLESPGAMKNPSTINDHLKVRSNIQLAPSMNVIARGMRRDRQD